MLKYCNDIAFIIGRKVARGIEIKNDGKDWPDIEILPDRSSACAENLELETV